MAHGVALVLDYAVPSADLIRDGSRFTEENAPDANDAYLHLARKRRSFPRDRARSSGAPSRAMVEMPEFVVDV